MSKRPSILRTESHITSHMGSIPVRKHIRRDVLIALSLHRTSLLRRDKRSWRCECNVDTEESVALNYRTSLSDPLDCTDIGGEE